MEENKDGAVFDTAEISVLQVTFSSLFSMKTILCSDESFVNEMMQQNPQKDVLNFDFFH